MENQRKTLYKKDEFRVHCPLLSRVGKLICAGCVLRTPKHPTRAALGYIWTLWAPPNMTFQPDTELGDLGQGLGLGLGLGVSDLREGPPNTFQRVGVTRLGL